MGTGRVWLILLAVGICSTAAATGWVVYLEFSPRPAHQLRLDSPRLHQHSHRHGGNGPSQPVFHPGTENPRPMATSLAGHDTDCPILMYHYIRNYRNPNDPLGEGLSISPHHFRMQIRYILHLGYHPVTLRHLADHIRYGRPLPRRCVAITLDDGYEDQFANGFRILHVLHVKATFFIVSGFVNTPAHVTWKQVRTMAREGMEIGAHTVMHPDLVGLPRSQVWFQIHHSKIAIERHLRRPLWVFAYPYGGFTPGIARMVQRAHFLAAVSTLGGTIHAQKSLFYLFREDMSSQTDLATIAYILRYRFGNPFESTPSHP